MGKNILLLEFYRSAGTKAENTPIRKYLRLGYAISASNKNVLAAILGAVMLYLPATQFNSYAYVQKPAWKQSIIDEFLAASKANDVRKLLHGIDMGIPVDSTDKGGRTALLIATYANAVDTVQHR